jgi:hypothetical protein
VVARALAGNNPVLRKAFRNVIDRPLDPERDPDAMLLEELDGFHTHPAGKDMGDPA